MSQDDPFAEPERTIIRPTPGGRRAAASTPPPQAAAPVDMPAFMAEPAPAVDVTFGALNPLIAAATPILSLLVRLRGAISPPNVEALRERIANELRVFGDRIGTTDMPVEAKRAGSYAVCAMIDDVISNTPWGSNQWARQTMTALFFKETSGGERFFQFLTQLHKDPGRFGDVLELMYLCLSLGFEGRLRVAGGVAELHRIREGLFNTLRQRRGAAERELSPHWRGIEAPHRPLTSFVPSWVVVAAAGALALVVYLAFYFAINGVSDQVYEKFAGLPPTGAVTLETTAPAPPPVIADGTLARLKAFLAPEVKEHLVELSETARTVTIRPRGREMFDSGSATLTPATLPLLNRIGAALDTEPGAVLIVGHTDNRPIRSVRFPSNFHLSTARATAVADLVKGMLKDPKRVTAEGRADAEPLVPNDTPANRALNRRIDLILTKQETAGR